MKLQINPLSVLVVALAAAPLSSGQASSGCGTQHDSGFHDNLSFRQQNGANRRYATYVPANYNTNPSLARTLVFDFHGAEGSPEGQYNNSQYFAHNGGNQYLVVYPAGLVGRTNNNATCGSGTTSWQGANYSCPGVDDLAFTNELLTHIEDNYCVNTSTVYASGKSNGGGFVDTLACSTTPGDRFSAFAMAAAALYTDNSQSSCSKRRAILEAHGQNDTTIYPGGGQERGGTTPNITTWTGWWGLRDGCSLSQRNVTPHTGYNMTTFSCGTGLANVVNQYWVYNNGHCWPSVISGTTDGARDVCRSRVLNFTDIVVAFFAKWNSSNAPKSSS